MVKFDKKALDGLQDKAKQAAAAPQVAKVVDGLRKKYEGKPAKEIESEVEGALRKAGVKSDKKLVSKIAEAVSSGKAFSFLPK